LAGRDGRPLVLNGFDRADLVGAAVLARTRAPAPVIITDCTWQTGRSPLDRLLTRIGVRALSGRRTTFCASSTQERERFPAMWRISPEQVQLHHWYHGLDDEDLDAQTSEDGPIFSGGRSLRDFTPLLRGAAELPWEVRIAADPAEMPKGEPVPRNVTVGIISHDDYMAMMRRASMVIVPLERREDRSAGQSTYLTSMAMGKLTAVTETLAVRDHIDNGRTGFVIPAGDAKALAETIRWAKDPSNAADVRAIRERGRDVVRARYGPDQHIATMLELVDELSTQPAAASGLSA